MATPPNAAGNAALCAVWQTIHRAALTADAAPDNELDSTAQMFSNLLQACKMMLCTDCVHHMNAYIAQHPLPSARDRALFAYTVSFHNDVNARLGKSIVSLEDARAMYQSSATDTSCPSFAATGRSASPHGQQTPTQQRHFSDANASREVFVGAAVATGLAWLGVLGFLVSRA
jgi:hypothetical protein